LYLTLKATVAAQKSHNLIAKQGEADYQSAGLTYKTLGLLRLWGDKVSECGSPRLTAIIYPPHAANAGVRRGHGGPIRIYI